VKIHERKHLDKVWPLSEEEGKEENPNERRQFSKKDL
jgi:hypothetical protein